MKKPLLVTYMVAAFLMIFTQCSDEEQVTPNEQLSSVSDEGSSQQRENAVAKKHTGKYITTPVTGTIDGIAFTAEYRITEFVHEHNQALYAVGTLANIAGEGLPGAVSGLAGQTIRMPVQIPAEDARASASGRITCDVLLLDLGPLDLDLLGLQIHLNEVVLEIVAEAAAGNLLGNLLCAVVSLLDGGVALAAIAELLNQIIDIIGILG